jgi:hypothetical protein
MEVGLVAPLFSRHGADWDYFTIREGIEVVRVAEEDGSPLYTHTYIVSPSFATCFTNSTIDGRPGCALSDLLEQHPEQPELHRVYGRKDDLIILSSGFKACTCQYLCHSYHTSECVLMQMGPVPIGIFFSLRAGFIN